MAQLHILKLCVGIDSVDHLRESRAAHNGPNDHSPTRHVTRMWPKREAEILAGGSLYWVIKGVVQARQTILRFDEIIGADGIRRCGIIMAPEIIETAPAPRRAFQGWRYLKGEDAPVDLPKSRASDDTLPAELATALADIGLR
ncbi:DUF1489 family protein [Halocynthiibacter namhaensis]|uniref:DUF1489 family protein n=1 Tax=Halocynthiibacter namhaensis TaxID=1290553 RepID=UPI0005799BBE|nr:DUF1489 domain-containing protein [Halocynthiibacter namhaensis]